MSDRGTVDFSQRDALYMIPNLFKEIINIMYFGTAKYLQQGLFE